VDESTGASFEGALKLRPRRSVLFMPGSNVRAMNKARTLPADAVVFDLEDAVAPDAKPRAREQVAAAVNEGGYGSREVIVRVNPLDSPWGKDDLLAVAPLAVDGVLIPKVERPEQVHATLQTLDAANRERHSLWVMIETPAGVLASDEIASGLPGDGHLGSRQGNAPPRGPGSPGARRTAVAVRACGARLRPGCSGRRTARPR
jgi:hypothetical protein